MAYYVSDGTLNLTQSFTLQLYWVMLVSFVCSYVRQEIARKDIFRIPYKDKNKELFIVMV